MMTKKELQSERRAVALGTLRIANRELRKSEQAFTRMTALHRRLDRTIIWRDRRYRYMDQQVKTVAKKLKIATQEYERAMKQANLFDAAAKHAEETARAIIIELDKPSCHPRRKSVGSRGNTAGARGRG